MLAKRRDALRACVLNGQQASAVGMARHSRDFDRFARERVGHIDAVPAGVRDAVAEMADLLDQQAFNHGARR
jgi:hypothetical protein